MDHILTLAKKNKIYDDSRYKYTLSVGIDVASSCTVRNPQEKIIGYIGASKVSARALMEALAQQSVHRHQGRSVLYPTFYRQV